MAALLAACPSSGPPAGRLSPGAASPSPGPRSGELVLAYPYEPATLNPFARGGDAPATRDLTRLVMPALYRLGPDGGRAPWLLASEPAVSDAAPREVILDLREDAVWSDGTPISASDLRFTWQTVMSARFRAATRDGYDRLADVEALSPKRARLVFREPFARWRDLFSAGLGVLPAHALRGRDAAAALARAWPVSGGPFVLRRWTRGLEIVFERNPRAWGDEPRLDRIRVAFVADSLSALRLLRQGRVGALGPYQSIDFARRAALVPGATVSGDAGATWAGLYLNTRTAPFSDVTVRRALALALDAERITTGIVRAEGEPIRAPPAGAAAPPGLLRSDPEAAVALLDDDGWRGSPVRSRRGIRLAFTAATLGGALPGLVLRAVRTQASDAGFSVEPVPLEPETFWLRWLPSSRLEAALAVWRDPPGGALRARFGSGSPGNVSGLSDARLDALLDAADRGDPAALSGAQRRIAALVPVVPLYRVRVTLVGRGVDGLRASAAADGPLWNAHEWSLR